MTRQSWDYLFSEYDLRQILEYQLKTINDKVIAVPKEKFETQTDEQIAAAVASELVVDVTATTSGIATRTSSA